MSSDVEPNASPDDKSHADIAIVAALHIEVAPLLERCERQRKYTGGDFTFRGGLWREGDVTRRVAFVEGGSGRSRARKATQAMIDAHTPRWVLSVGFSGALRPNMSVGQIVVADEVVDLQGHAVKIDMTMPADPQRGLHVGRIVTADDLVRTVAEKAHLAGQTGAVAVDLESLAVVNVCRERNTRCLVVRVISDDMSADLPPEVLAILGPTGTIRAGALAGAVWKRPGSVKDMWQLRQQATMAAERLATFLDGVVPQLDVGEHDAGEQQS